MPARLINIKYITIRAQKVASPVTALHSGSDNFDSLEMRFGHEMYRTGSCPVYDLRALIKCLEFSSDAVCFSDSK